MTTTTGGSFGWWSHRRGTPRSAVRARVLNRRGVGVHCSVHRQGRAIPRCIRGSVIRRIAPLLESEDAWGNTMTYSSDGRSYSVVSSGPDGESGSADDIALRDGAIAGGGAGGS